VVVRGPDIPAGPDRVPAAAAKMRGTSGPAGPDFFGDLGCISFKGRRLAAAEDVDLEKKSNRSLSLEGSISMTTDRISKFVVFLISIYSSRYVDCASFQIDSGLN